MPNYFSNDFKSSVSDALSSLHDSIKREITLYYDTPQDTAASDLNTNPIFGRSSSCNTRTTPQKTSETINARIRYVGKQDDDFINFQGNVIVKSEGMVRIKVKKQYESKVERASNFEIDNQLFVLNSDKYKVGPWPDDANNEDFSMYYLKRAD